MDPLLEVQRKSRGMDRDAYQKSLDRPVKAVTESTPYRLADLILNGEDVDLPMAESLIPTVPLQAKLKQGKTPGLADILDIPSPVKAMGPIAFGLKEFRNGARMGKTLRNIEKAKNPVIERWHRTRSKNRKSIADNGLLVGEDNPNYGKNTGDADQLPLPVAWLGNNPVEIPVLQLYNMDKKNLVDVYKVKIPKDVYYNTPRLKWEQGYRGNASDAVVVPKGKSSLTGETGRRTGLTSKIDLFGASVKPEWIERVPRKTLDKWEKHDKQMANFGGEVYSQVPNMSKSDVGNDIVRTWMSNDWVPAIDRFYEGKMAPLDMDSPFTPQEQIHMNSLAHGKGTPKYGTPVYNEILPDKFKVSPEFWFGYKYPEEVNKFAKGHVSRGWDTSVDVEGMDLKSQFNPSERMFNWDKYNRMVSDGWTPAAAAAYSGPNKRITDTPDGLKVEEFPKGVNVNVGPMSRGLSTLKGQSGRLYELLGQAGLTERQQIAKLRNVFENYIDDVPGPISSDIIEKIMTSEGGLNKLRPATENMRFSVLPGSVLRGNSYDDASLKQIFNRDYEDALSNAVNKFDNIEDAIEYAETKAKMALQKHMKARSYSNASEDPVKIKLKDIMQVAR